MFIIEIASEVSPCTPRSRSRLWLEWVEPCLLPSYCILKRFSSTEP